MSTEIKTRAARQAGANDAEARGAGGAVNSSPRRPRGRRVGILILAALVALAGVLMLPVLRWRVRLLALELTGQIPDLRLSDLLPMMMPGSGQIELSDLPGTRNPYPVIIVPPLSAAQRAAGVALYAEHCAGCHAPNGTGGPSAPALVGRPLAHGDTPWAMYRTIRDGVAGTGMPPHPLGRRPLWELVSYVRTLRARTVTPRVATGVARELDAIEVPYAQLASTPYAGDDWLTYGGSYNSSRFSTLTQINGGNVSTLALRWLYPFPGNRWKIECSPLVRDGIMYVTGPAGEVMALDALTGVKLWEHDHPFKLVGKGEGPVGQNRGVALLGHRVFVATWNSTLTALSAATGKVLWEQRVGPYPGTWISAAPLAFHHLVVVGVTTPTDEGRGYLAAYDVRTGRLRWRFMTIPGPGEPGHDTWPGDSWRVGGAGPWMSGSYDPKSDVLYWGVGGARPDFDASSREGADLYSDSLLAIRGTSGKLLWYFQSSPGDTHDWDAVQVPLIADRTVDGQAAPRLLWANRNGFYYVLNRATGAFVRAVPFVRENWASGLDAEGHPILAPVSRSAQGHVVFPSANGATNWWPPSYDPDLGLTYIPVLEEGMTFFPTHYSLPSAETTFRTAVRAVDAYSGKLVWQHQEPQRTGDFTVSGLLSTRGGLVFAAADNEFFALDARTGKTLWTVRTGGTTYAAPVTFSVSGEQFVSVVIGRDLLTFALPQAPEGGTKTAGAASHEEAHAKGSRTRAPR
ncbi:MAG TPA: PQQ-binding-like beta-propeller repeat protein [Steroidobacteraceae bacterium]|nr:PQQ-binding-like beta-propeller repeat protein [Steroidobacteraceae bacterium]